MGCTQSAWPLWAARISFSRQIGLLGARHGVAGSGLGDQLNQIFGACCALAGVSAKAIAAAAIHQFPDFIKITPQDHVFCCRNNVHLKR